MSIEAMKQALEALEELVLLFDRTREFECLPMQLVRANAAQKILRAAIAEAAMQRLTDVQQAMEAPRVNQCAEVCERAKLCAICARGLEEMEHSEDALEMVEPVAWMVTTEMQDGTRQTYPLTGRYKDVCDACDFGDPIPLYTHPPRRDWVGLTDDEIDSMRQGAQGLNFVTLREFRIISRAIELKLKDKNT